MNTKKKMVLGAAFVVAIMALAGVGYAAWSGTYTGTTTSGDNDVDVDYVTVSLNAPAYAGSALVHIDYNTSTDASGTTFQCNGSETITHTLTIATPEDSTDADTFVLKVSATLTDLTSKGYTLYYKVGDNDAAEFTNNSNLGITLGTAAELKAGVSYTILWYVYDTTSGIYNGFVPRSPVPPAVLEIPEITYLVTGTNVDPSPSP